MMGLTPRQRDALVYLTAYPDASYGEVARALGTANKSTAFRIIRGLEERGYIRRLIARARSIEVLNPAPVIINGERYRFIPVRP